MLISVPAPFRVKYTRPSDDPLVFELHVKEDKYLFQPEQREDGLFDLCIIKLPENKGREFDSLAKNTFRRGDHEYVWVKHNALTTIDRTIRVARIYAKKMSRYINTGRKFSFERDNDI